MPQVILGPDIYVNASVALGSAPEQVARRVLRADKQAGAATEWILARVRQMLTHVPGFKDDAVEGQLELIRSLVRMVADQQHAPEAWEEALVAAAKGAGVRRVVTDHPDLLQIESSQGIEFMSSEAWLLEAGTPPPPPTTRH